MTLAGRVAELTSGKVAHSTVVTPWAVIAVVKNTDHDAIRKAEDPDGFLFFSQLLEIDPEQGTPRSEYVRRIGDLLNDIWNAGLRAVAACDFEDELPRRGGYRWPHRDQA